MEQQINVVEPVSKAISVKPDKKVKISRFQSLLNRVSKYRLEKKKRKLEEEKQEIENKAFINNSSLTNINKRLDNLNCTILNTDLGVKTKRVTRIKKSKAIRVLARGFELIGERVTAINEAVSKKMWGYVANKLEEYGYSQDFAKAADAVVAHSKDDFSFADNADSLSKSNDKIEKERQMINEADKAINEAFGMTFSGEKKVPVDEIEEALVATDKFPSKPELEPLKFSDNIDKKKEEEKENGFNNKPIFETEPLRITDKSMENKEEKKETKFNNKPVFETGPLRLTDNLMEKQSEKVAEINKATNATISSDYSNSALEDLLSELHKLQEDTRKQRSRNGQIKEEKEKQDSVNRATREEAGQLAREKAERNKALLEFVRENINKQREEYNQAKEEGNNLQQQLSSAKETGKDLEEDLFKNRSELTSINAKYDQIAKMIDESNAKNAPDLENTNTLTK